MARALSRRLIIFAAGSLHALWGLTSISAKSASALAAWSLTSDGVLQLRTSKDARLEAYFQRSGGGKGQRVWIDFPGELHRPRSLKGSGPVRQIRLGKPTSGFTRLVIEFHPYVALNPSKLRLIGISPDRWKMQLKGLPIQGLKRISEGNLQSSLSTGWPKKTANNYQKSSSSLPRVQRGKYRVVIDPGHGGPDVGAVGIDGLRETDVVLDISLKVTKILRNQGVKVNLTRRYELDLDLPPRVALANRLGADAFVSIHANATRGTRSDVNGIETFFFTGSRALNLAQNIQQQLLRVAPGSPDRGVRRGRFFVIRRTRMPAVLVETGFVTGRMDSRRLSNAIHRDQLAEAISIGILRYLKGLR